MMNFNLKQFEVFAAVVECGGFTAAAEKLYLAQSTVSGHVTAMEKDLGVPMLVRSGKRKIILTEEGKRVYAYVKTILQTCDQLSKELEEHTSFELVLAASTIPMNYLLPGLIAQFAKEMPQCRFTVKSGDSKQVHEMVLDGDAQIGFVGGVLNRKEFDYYLLREERLVLLTPDNERYRTLRQAGVLGNELLSEPLIFREEGSGTQQAVDKFLCENRISSEETRVIARIYNNDAILHAVSMGLGVTIMSELAVGKAENVLAFPLEGKSSTRCLYMIQPKNRRYSDMVLAFSNFVQECMNHSPES